MKTYLDEDIIYYGPHPCERCGHMIVKMGKEFGGNSFDQPLGPVYPNHRWNFHVCDPNEPSQPPTPSESVQPQ